MHNRSILDLDHPMISVADRAAAMTQYEKLGFVVRGARQNAPMGGGAAGGIGGSAAILFPSQNPDAANMLEIAYCDWDHAAPFMKEIMGRIEGVVMLVHGTQDARSLHQQWTEAGLHLMPVTDIVFSGHTHAPGQTMQLIIPEPGRNLINCNAVQFETLEEFRNPELMGHPNTACGWDMATIVVPQANYQETLQYFEKVYGDAGEAFANGGRLFIMTKTAVRVLTHPAATDYYKGLLPASDESPLKIASLRILVRDMSVLRKRLDDQDVTYRETDNGGIFTPADEACGVVLEFTQASF